MDKGRFTGNRVATQAAEAIEFGGAGMVRPLDVWLLGFSQVVKGQPRGFARVQIPPGLVLEDCPILMAPSGRAWCGLPAKLDLDETGQQCRDANGKKLFAAVLRWASRDLSNSFSDAVRAAIRTQFPEVLGSG